MRVFLPRYPDARKQMPGKTGEDQERRGKTREEWEIFTIFERYSAQTWSEIGPKSTTKINPDQIPLHISARISNLKSKRRFEAIEGCKTRVFQRGSRKELIEAS